MWSSRGHLVIQWLSGHVVVLWLSSDHQGIQWSSGHLIGHWSTRGQSLDILSYPMVRGLIIRSCDTVINILALYEPMSAKHKMCNVQPNIGSPLTMNACSLQHSLIIRQKLPKTYEDFWKIYFIAFISCGFTNNCNYTIFWVKIPTQNLSINMVTKSPYTTMYMM